MRFTLPTLIATLMVTTPVFAQATTAQQTTPGNEIQA